MTAMLPSTWVDSKDATLFWDGAIRARIAHCESTAPRSTSADALRLQALEDDASTMKLAVFSLLEHRNSRVPINRLPVEILARVFSFYARIDIPGATMRAVSPATPRRRSLGWITITFVCRRWRQVASHHASLWSTVKFALGWEWAKEMVSRAKSVPLDVVVVKPLSAWQADLIIKNIPSIEALCLGENVSADPIIDALSIPVPLLKVLRIESRDIVECPDDFLGNYAPNLHTLSVQNMSNFPWFSSIFGNLVFFQLAHSSPHGPTLSALLSALNSMPRLRRLKLQSSLPRHLAEKPDIMVKLPCLTSFEGWDHVRGWAHLLSHLDIPTTASVDLAITYSGTESQVDAGFAFFTPTLGAFLRGSGTSAEAMSSISLDTHFAFKISATRDILPYKPRIDLELHPDVWTVHERGPPSVRAARILAAICSEHSKNLSVRSEDTGWSPSLWLDIIAGAPMLQTISAERQAAEMLCIALQMSADSKSQGAAHLGAVKPNITLLPALRELSLRRVDFTSIAESTAEYPSFQDCLATRAKEKMLRKLVLRECKIRGEWVDDLRRVVGDVQLEESSSVGEQ